MKTTSIVIIGLGLIGGSIAKDLKSRYPTLKIYALDSDESQLDTALKEKMIDNVIEVDEVLECADFIIIATPIVRVIPLAKDIARRVKKGGGLRFPKYYVMDVASVKGDITQYFERLSNSRVEFVSTHPMAGTEFKGYAHARKGIFRAKPWMVCVHSANTPSGIARVERLIRALGGRVRGIEAGAHDIQVATVSHSVILLSNYIFDFIATSQPEALELAGDGFTSTTRLASGNPELHADIFANNKTLTLQQLKAFHAYLGEMISREGGADRAFFANNSERRNHWVHKRH